MAQTIKLKRSSVSGRVPTTSDLELGEVAINTYDGKMYIKKSVGGTETVVSVGGGALATSFTLYEYTATSGQTTFSGSDGNSNTLAYDTGTPPKILVYLNGVLLDHSTDYTATNGTSVVLTNGAATNDLLQIAAYKSTVTSDQNLDLDDNQKILLGDDDDLEIYHDGSNSYIKDVGTGSLAIQASQLNIDSSNGSEYQATFIENGAVSLYYDGSKKFETTSGGIQVQGAMAATTGAYSPIYYGGSSSLQLKSNTGELFGQFTNNGAAELYYDNSKKFETTNDGISVTGDVEATGEIIGDLRGATLFKAQAGEALTKGEVVYISGVSGNTTVVSKADADDANKMPAFGLVAASASSGNPVDIYTAGILTDIDTSSFSEGDELFVSTTAGALTSTAPTGESAALQKIGKVTRSDATGGRIFIIGAGRTNAVPNLNEGKLFVGNSSNQAVADNTVHVDIANSRVGIGTTSPNYKLDVVSTGGGINIGGTGAFLRWNSGDIQIKNEGSYKMGFYTYNSSDAALNQHMVIDTNGYVGIGTASPAVELDVKRHTNAYPLRIGSSQGEGRAIVFADVAGTPTKYNWIAGAQYNINDGFEITPSTAVGGYTFSSPALVIKQDGKVGIGVTSPGGVFEVDGTYGDFTVGNPSIGSRLTYYDTTRITLDSNNINFYTNSLTQRMRIDSSGNVGIGTTTLSAITSSVATLSLGGTNAGISGGIAYQTNGTAEAYHYTQSDFLLHQALAGIGQRFLTNNTERMRIDTSGHVLIGTTDTTPYNNSADSTADRGIVLRAEGYISAAAYQQSALDINRTGNNGNVVNFYRSGTSAGSISVNDGYIGVGAGAVYLGYYTDGSNNKSIIPMANSTGAAAAGTIGLGINNANHKFKDAWITGAVNCGSISTGNITTSGYLAGPATFTIDPAAVGDNTGTVVIAGNLQVDGTTTTINSTTLTVDDLNITLASGSANSAAANGAGITVDIANNTNPTLLYNGTLDTWEFNKRVDVTSEVRLFRSDGTRSGSLLHNTSGTVLRTNSNGDNLYLQTAGTGNVYLQPSTAGYSTVVNEDGIDSDFRVESDGNTHAFFVDAGNSRLGINTSSLTADGLIIGTNNSNCELDLHNTGGSGTRWRFNSSAYGHLQIENKTDSTIPLTIRDNGRVGIGTTSPNEMLQIDSADSAIRVNTTNAVNNSELQLIYNNSTNGMFFRYHPNSALAYIDNTYPRTQGQSYGDILFRQNYAGTMTEHMRLTAYDGFLGIGTNTPKAKLQVEVAGIDTTTTSTTATTQVAIDTFAAATFRSARYTIQVTNSTDSTYHLTEVLLIHDGTTPQITEYGTIFTGSAEATFDADISSGNVRLLATPATTDSMTFKVVRHCITV